MYEDAKKARLAMKAKAKSLASADPHQKVDSSTWSPPEPLNTTAKTGMRPVSRRAFKAGGKVEGEKAKCNMGRKPRKSGGESTSWVNAKINRNVKDANEEREGIKHVGGMKKGGRAGKEEGGFLQSAKNRIRSALGYDRPDYSPKMGPETGSTSKMPSAEDREALKRKIEESAPRKSGGRAKKAGGGDLEAYGKGVSGAADMMKKASARAGVPGGLYGSGFTRVGAGKLSPAGAAVPMSRMKKGGTAKSEDFKSIRAKYGTQVMEKGGSAKHPDEAMDKALIKKMVKPSARTGKTGGGGIYDRVAASTKRMGRDLGGPTLGIHGTRQKEGEDFMSAKDMLEVEGMKKDWTDPSRNKGQGPTKKAAERGELQRKDGGRAARKSGGRTKGKTNINIVIAAGKPAGQGDMMPPGGPTLPPGMGAAPGGLPIPVPAAGGAPGGAPMPMPMPMPAPAPAAGPAPTPRRDGGRLTKRAASYKDMEAGAGSGEGRLQKTDIAKRIPKPTENGVIGTANLGYPNKVPGATGGRTARKAGGKAYRSYKDMDAGAGSGMGRLEKTEIQARKG